MGGNFSKGDAEKLDGMWFVSGEAGWLRALRRGAAWNETRTMALLFGDTPGAREPRTIAILAKTIYRELRSSGFDTRDVIALAGELLSHVTSEVRARGDAGGGGAKSASKSVSTGGAPPRKPAK
jgi:hypothetical protein